ncbi:MAG: hypothetical protein MJA29_09930, partial [Candidatus Omnitrophica bacterium]|nr:hypothetical protein [Candidatus Omnitrophota bacterium]
KYELISFTSKGRNTIKESTLERQQVKIKKLPNSLSCCNFVFDRIKFKKLDINLLFSDMVE